MFVLKNTFRILLRSETKIKNNLQRLRCLSDQLSFKKELTVPTFCNVTVNVPFNIELKVLDVHKFTECNKLFLELNNSNNETGEPLIIVQDDNSVYIKSSNSEMNNIENTICTIVAPVKANLNVISKFGKIAINNFNSEAIKASTETGDIIVNGFQGGLIDVKTKTGNVNLAGSIQSSLINVLVLEKGSVFINKLLGEQARIETRLGNVSVNSSYCNKANFILEEGDMNLKNIHKYCEIDIRKMGNIKMTCFDGHLILKQSHGNADIHLSRITDNSEMNLDKGQLLLRVSEECQENIKFNIRSKSTNINEDVKVEQIDSNHTLSLSTQNTKKKVVFLNCQDCLVDIEAASWFDMNSLKELKSV